MATGTISSISGITDADISALAAIDPTKIAQRVNAVHVIPLTSWRVHDALATVLPGTPASDDLGLVGGTFGTNAPSIRTEDLKAEGGNPTNNRARAIVQVPPTWESGQSLTFRAVAGMVTTVADVSATLDVEVWRVDRDGTLGSADICATSATTINSLTAANIDFSITVSSLSPGDSLDIRITTAVTDTATATAVIAAIWDTMLLADLR